MSKLKEPSVTKEGAVSKAGQMTLSQYLMKHRNADDYRTASDYNFPLAPRIVCRDEFSLSVQATHGAYCSPRRNIGPWYQVEVGFPSAEPELIMGYCESPETPTETVYGYVPIELVEQLIALHGGSDQLSTTKD